MFYDTHSMSVYLQRFDLITVHERIERANWCQDTFGYQHWWVDGNTFYFHNEQDFALFQLKWA